MSQIDDALQDLRAALADEAVLTCDPDVIAAYSGDRAMFSPQDGAIALIRAQGIADVQAVMRTAHTHAIPVVTQGARTGLSGGANGSAGAILLNLERMDQILHIDPVERLAVVQPGVVNQHLKDALAPLGMSYPPDPGSVAISTIGGNIATNAGGLCCVKYGVTRDYVRTLTVVTADGSVAKLGSSTVKGVAGFDLRGLFIGSEGTLGVVVEATVKLVPLLPEPLTAVAVFPEALQALNSVAAFMGEGATPSMLEFMDSETIKQLNALGDFGLDDSAGAILLAQADGEDAVAVLERFTELAEGEGASEVVFSDDPADSAALVMIRRKVGDALEHHAELNGGGEWVEDVCVPRDKLPAFYEGLVEIRETFATEISLAGHAGDGNLHPTVFFDIADEDSVERARGAFDAIMRLGLDLGGTITGEHGIGFLKRGWLAEELDEGAAAIHRAVKRALDPQGILNPGKVLADFRLEASR